MTGEADRAPEVERGDLLRGGCICCRLHEPAERVPELGPEVGRDFHYDALTFEILKLLGRRFDRRLVGNDVEMDVVFFAIREIAIDALTLPLSDVRELALESGIR